MSARWVANWLCLILAAGLIAGCTRFGNPISIPSNKEGVDLDIWLSRPAGEGPFPAVVLLHGCSGTERETAHQTVWRGLARHAALLNENGYVAIVVDSFGPRGVHDGCVRPGYYLPMRVADAYATRDYLTELPFIDRDRIAVLGLSNGAGAALISVSNLATQEGFSPGAFAAAIAYYPYCREPFTRFDAPVLILIGEKDDWTPADYCRTLEHDFAGNSSLELVVYPDTYHSFDLPLIGRMVFHGHVVAPNRKARDDADMRVLNFLAKHLASE